MSLTPNQAKVIADYTLTDYEHERAPTKRVISAVPAGQESYAPSAKCMKSLDLAWHLASSELFFLNGVCSGQFSSGESKRPDHIRNAQDVLAWYEENLPPAVARARLLSAEQLAQVTTSRSRAFRKCGSVRRPRVLRRRPWRRAKRILGRRWRLRAPLKFLP